MFSRDNLFQEITFEKSRVKRVDEWTMLFVSGFAHRFFEFRGPRSMGFETNVALEILGMNSFLLSLFISFVRD